MNLINRHQRILIACLSRFLRRQNSYSLRLKVFFRNEDQMISSSLTIWKKIIKMKRRTIRKNRMERKKETKRMEKKRKERKLEI